MDEGEIIDDLALQAEITPDSRKRYADRAATLVNSIREAGQPGFMEAFLNEYGLSTHEGIALMCLAEALLRVPDTETIDNLVSDKIAPSSWGRHLGQSSSSLVNASTWALMLTGKVLENDDTSSTMEHVLHTAIKRLGEPVIRAASRRVMKEMGNQFILGETIEQAAIRAGTWRQKGYTCSFDMLGEAAVTAKDAANYFKAYRAAIEFLAVHADADQVCDNPGISVKLSALRPRYEVNQKPRAAPELTDRVLALALQAKQARIGLNIDAEEADRLDLSLDIIEAVLRDRRLASWDGFGVVIQAYGKGAGRREWRAGKTGGTRFHGRGYRRQAPASGRSPGTGSPAPAGARFHHRGGVQRRPPHRGYLFYRFDINRTGHKPGHGGTYFPRRRPDRGNRRY